MLKDDWHKKRNLNPGQTIAIKRGKERFICIKCSSGWISFRQFYYGPKKVMTPSDFFNGYMSKHKDRKQFFVSSEKCKSSRTEENCALWQWNEWFKNYQKLLSNLLQNKSPHTWWLIYYWLRDVLQWGSENRTCPDFEWPTLVFEWCTGPNHLTTRHF